jgi:uncharacterized membrane protein
VDTYTVLKFLHILCAIIWVGGGFSLVVLGVVANGRNDAEAILRIVKDVAFLSTRLFIPSSLATFVFGAATAYFGGYYGTLWVWIGLAGFVATFLTGALILGPTAEKIGRLEAAGQLAEASAIGKGLLKTAKFDYVVLVVVVADMVLKPGYSDVALLVIMLVLVAGGAYLYLGDLLKKPLPAAS